MLRRAASDLSGVAGAIEAARDRHADISVRIGSVVARTGERWVSPEADRFVADGRGLATEVGRLPHRLAAAAISVRTLATAAASVAEELAVRERAFAAAVAEMHAADRRRAATDVTDTTTLGMVAECHRAAVRDQRRARSDIRGCVARWESECRLTAAAVREAAGLVSGIGPGVGPATAPVPWEPATGRAHGFRSVVAGADALLARSEARTLIHGHGVLMFGQRVDTLGDMADAWMTRGYVRATTGPRALSATLGAVATLQWHGLPSAAENSRRASAVRVEAQTIRIADAQTVMRHGRGLVGGFGTFAVGPLGLVADGATVIQGSAYDGTRGSVDRGVAVVGAASTLVLLSAAVTVVAPVIAVTAVIGATAATAWGIGNLAYDHRGRIGRGAAQGRADVPDGVSAVGRPSGPAGR